MDITPRRQGSRLSFAFWIVICFVYFHVSYDYIRASMNDRQLHDYLTYVVQLIGNEHRPAKEARDLILVKADELGLPISSDQVRIVGDGGILKVSVAYNVDIQLPVINRVIYRKNFKNTAHYSQYPE